MLAARSDEAARKSALVEKVEGMLQEAEEGNDALKAQLESSAEEIQKLKGALADASKAGGAAGSTASSSGERRGSGATDGMQSELEKRAYVKTLEENMERLKRDNAKLQQAMVDMSDAHTQEILAYMQSAQSAAQSKKGSGWF